MRKIYVRHTPNERHTSRRQPNKKLDQRLKRNFTKDIQITNQHLKNVFNATLGKCKWKPQWATTPYWPESFKLRTTKPNVEEDVSPPESSRAVGRNAKWPIDSGGRWRRLLKVNIPFTYEPAILFLCIWHPRENIVTQKDLHKYVHSNFIYSHQRLETTRVFVRSKTDKQVVM